MRNSRLDKCHVLGKSAAPASPVIRKTKRTRSANDEAVAKSHENNSLVGAVDVVNCKNSKVAVVTEVTQGDTGARLKAGLFNDCLGSIQSNGHREEVAVGKTRLGDDARKPPPLAKLAYLRISFPLCTIFAVCLSKAKATPHKVGWARL